MRIKTKNPLLDQTGGPREEKLEKNQSQPVHQRRTPKSTGKSTEGSKSLHKSDGESSHAEEPMHTAMDLEEPAYQEFDTGATEDQPDDKTTQPSDWLQKPTRLPSPDHDWNKTSPTDHGPVQPCRTYATSITKTKAADYGHIKWIKDLVPNTMWSEVSVNYDKHALWGISDWGRKRQQFYAFAANRESTRDVYYKRIIIADGDFKRLRLQDIEDMLILFAQGKLTNLNVEDRPAFGVSLRMFTRSIVIQRCVEDLQLGVESYQKKLNITKPDTYRSDLKCRDAYTAYSNPRGFIYQNKDKKNKLMRIDELHKFSDSTLDVVRTTLNDHLKGNRMEYLPQTIWRLSDRERAKAMIQAIDKQLKSRRIM
ncbi:hypothetical protein Tco_1042117 [Tanacetum coccineum]|uniref:Uncharacterized protein n=1 Tax=Tanacetum coccineum TaxID=301880 RepID=A0ABQ5GI43_9ASTR